MSSRHYLTRRYTDAVLYDGDGNAANVTLTPTTDPLTLTPERTLRGTGAERPTGLTEGAFEIVPSGLSAHRQVRAWDAAGTPLRALAVGSGLNAIWDEPVAPVLNDRAVEPMRLDGLTVRLYKRGITLAAGKDYDLLFTLTDEWEGEAERPVPIPGLTVYAYVPGDGGEPSEDVTITALDFGGDDLASDGPDYHPTLTLPPDTWSVKVESASDVRPVLVTRPAPGYDSAGGWLLLGTTVDTATLRPYGRESAVETPHAITYHGITSDVPTAVLSGGDVTDNGDGTATIHTQTA